MNNIKLTDLVEVATHREIAKAFGAKSSGNVAYWLKQGDDIPAKIRGLYASKELPNESKDALKLYRRALKHVREKRKNAQRTAS